MMNDPSKHIFKMEDTPAAVKNLGYTFFYPNHLDR